MNFKTAIFCILSVTSSVILFAPGAVETVQQPATPQSSLSYYNPLDWIAWVSSRAAQKVYQTYQGIAGSKPIETVQPVVDDDMQLTQSEEVESVAQSSSMQSEKRSATILDDVLDQMSKNNFSSSSVVEVKHELPFRNEPAAREQGLGVYQLFISFLESFRPYIFAKKYTAEEAVEKCKEKLEAFVNESSNLGVFDSADLKSEILGHLEQIFANAYDDKTLLLYLKNSLDKEESKVLLTIKNDDLSLNGLSLNYKNSLQQVIDAAYKFKNNFEIKFFVDYLTLLKDCQDIKVNSTPEAVVAVQKYLDSWSKKEMLTNHLREQELPEADDEPAVPVQVFNPPVKSNQANNEAKGFSPQTSWSNMPHRLSEQAAFEAGKYWSAAKNRSVNNFGRGQGAFTSVPRRASPSRSANNFTIQEVSQKPELKSISTQTETDSARSLRLNSKPKKFRKKRGMASVRFTPRLENEENLKNELPFYGDQTTANQRINNLSRSLNNIRTLSSDGI